MRGVHVALMWQIILMCNVPVLRFFMTLVWNLIFFVLVKYTLNPRVPIAYQAIKLRTRYLPAALLSIARRRCDVCMANRSCYERSAIVLKTGLNNCRTLENEAIVQRRSATLKAFDGVALQWLSLRFEIRSTFPS